uniref:hypothetical protein n=1 Tax=Pseudonocardia sp. CA-138482 TaxID=3240023 RepID=UPI003F493717
MSNHQRPEPAIVPVTRALTKDEATAMVGDDVPAAAPTITAATIAVDADTNEPVFAYLPLGDVGELRRAVLAPHYGEGMIRANGVRNRARTFGYSPRRPVYRREGCASTALAGEHPAEHAVICNFADRLADVLAEIDPRLVTRACDAVTEVEPDWRLGETKLWTSGVINQSAVLPWHRDAFNFPAWSAMPVLRRHIDGGHLRIAEYDATIACRDGWGVFFAGFELVHGVTPMRLRRPDGYRFSIVYYALKGMRDCFTAALETAYARRRRTEREQDMACRVAAGEPALVDQGRGLPRGRGPSGRRMGNRDVLNSRYAPQDHAERKANLTGDPTAIEDAYLADQEGA